ncbi:MAG: AAA family ATPase, partial [candidate division NC10 bacterium]|nr:AAA family ATPase [candidate division NC10 bacterium]
PLAPKFSSPQAYTPKHLAEKILTSKTALEGERKQVTVLFADLKGSMELLADRDPEEARKLLDPVLDRMMEAVHRYEGTVNQVMGDGIMALFGAPLAHEDHAVRACYAALRMQAAVQRHGEEVRRAVGVPVQIRVGLNSGEVVVRAIGSDLHMDYTAVGQTTHLAARMEQAALPGSILLPAATLRLAEGYIRVKALGPIPVKGLSEPVEVYELLGAEPVRSRLQAAAARGLTRFVGRETDLEALRHALEKARAGRGQVVALVGEPGVGKSRLLWEFARSHRTHGWLILETGSASYGKATPYLPILDLLKAYFQIEDRDAARQIREKITGKLLTLDRVLEPALPAFLALLDVAVEDPQWQALDPLQRRHRTLEALKRLLLRESQVQPLLLVFEDLHWIDAETQALLDSLIESLPTARLLLLVNYRPEYQHGWGSKTYYTQLRLDPLPPASAEEFLQALLGADAGLQPVNRLLIAQTQGNPFFLEESVRTLLETQVLVGERGAYRLAKALPAIQVPPTVQAVLAARIDRLPPEEKRLLQAAAVIGEEVPLSLLQAIAEEPEEALRLRLSHLQAAEFLYEARLFPDLVYTFKHGLTYQVAYQSLLQERRRALHARIVETLERLYPDRLTEEVNRLAHHAFRGEVWAQAVTYSRQAGSKAAARSAYREAVVCFEQALVALQHLPERQETIEQAIDLRCDLRNAHLPLGEHERMVEHIHAAEPLARALNDPFRSARVLAYMSTNFFIAGDHHRAIDAGEHGLAIAAGLGDLGLETELNLRLALVHCALGDYRRALDLTRRNVELLTGDRGLSAFIGPHLTSVLSRAWLVRSLAEVGRFVEAVPLAEEAVQIAEEVDHASSLGFARWGLGALYLQKGAL